MDNKSIRLCHPWTSSDELEAIKEVLDSGYLTQGPKTEEFEQVVAKYLGARYAFATSSCTTALHLSLVALGIKPGDDVLVPDFTFPATANVVIQQGAKPVLVDVSVRTFNMDIEDLQRKYTPQTRAILPVHAFGRPAAMDPILEFARAKRLPVLEDAACAIGATYRGKLCGTLGQLGCFSFHPRKIVTTGEGGMITTDDDDLAEKIVILRNHGGIRKDGRYEFVGAGFNYRMSDFNAAIGVVQMAKLEDFITRRRRLANLYCSHLQDIPGLQLPYEEQDSMQTYQSFVVRLPEGTNRDGIIARMKQVGVETTIGTYALHTEPYFRQRYGYRPGDLPGSYECATRSLTLPLYPQLTDEDMAHVACVLSRCLA
ncbi:MAG TPA: DegT/DnrJ/EryC1/StrS family aminotransferase [Ktedonobacteraceae bacterium]|nr:DegT/DnrJ/EryC1/StrS family aminotransferase [Ktedonobacteraceae bacterium]